MKHNRMSAICNRTVGKKFWVMPNLHYKYLFLIQRVVLTSDPKPFENVVSFFFLSCRHGVWVTLEEVVLILLTVHEGYNKPQGLAQHPMNSASIQCCSRDSWKGFRSSLVPCIFPLFFLHLGLFLFLWPFSRFLVPCSCSAGSRETPMSHCSHRSFPCHKVSSPPSLILHASYFFPVHDLLLALGRG